MNHKVKRIKDRMQKEGRITSAGKRALENERWKTCALIALILTTVIGGEGWVFDLLFGAECCFNLVWDIILFKALRRRDKIVRTLLWFLRATTVAVFFCYGAAVCEMFVSVKYASILAQGGAFYTITVLAKIAVLYGIYCYYRRYKDNGDSLEEYEANIADAMSQQQPSLASIQSSHSGSGRKIPTSAGEAATTINTSGGMRTVEPHSSH
ncbi:uncharacterized protein LOC142573924 isoform X2 [Dermacentor variabilis]|uniref:uncharacterized protein LOC142573924 isoform X2 n=1 Tax=Dermacentor variabilis TaxID=34621 RepID=UPI003F5C6204